MGPLHGGIPRLLMAAWLLLVHARAQPAAGYFGARREEQGGLLGDAGNSDFKREDLGEARGSQSLLKPGMVVVLQGHRGKYCSAGGGHTDCNAATPGHWERFKCTDAGGGFVALCALGGACNVEQGGDAIRLRAVSAGGGAIALQQSNNAFCSDTAGGVTCTASAIGVAETFTVHCIASCGESTALFHDPCGVPPTGAHSSLAHAGDPRSNLHTLCRPSGSTSGQARTPQFTRQLGEVQSTSTRTQPLSESMCSPIMQVEKAKAMLAEQEKAKSMEAIDQRESELSTLLKGLNDAEREFQKLQKQSKAQITDVTKRLEDLSSQKLSIQREEFNARVAALESNGDSVIVNCAMDDAHGVSRCHTKLHNATNPEKLRGMKCPTTKDAIMEGDSDFKRCTRTSSEKELLECPLGKKCKARCTNGQCSKVLFRNFDAVECVGSDTPHGTCWEAEFENVRHIQLEGNNKDKGGYKWNLPYMSHFESLKYTGGSGGAVNLFRWICSAWEDEHKSCNINFEDGGRIGGDLLGEIWGVTKLHATLGKSGSDKGPRTVACSPHQDCDIYDVDGIAPPFGMHIRDPHHGIFKSNVMVDGESWVARGILCPATKACSIDFVGEEDGTKPWPEHDSSLYLWDIKPGGQLKITKHKSGGGVLDWSKTSSQVYLLSKPCRWQNMVCGGVHNGNFKECNLLGHLAGKGVQCGFPHFTSKSRNSAPSVATFALGRSNYWSCPFEVPGCWQPMPPDKDEAPHIDWNDAKAVAVRDENYSTQTLQWTNGNSKATKCTRNPSFKCHPPKQAFTGQFSCAQKLTKNAPTSLWRCAVQSIPADTIHCVEKLDQCPEVAPAPEAGFGPDAPAVGSSAFNALLADRCSGPSKLPGPMVLNPKFADRYGPVPRFLQGFPLSQLRPGSLPVSKPHRAPSSKLLSNDGLCALSGSVTSIVQADIILKLHSWCKPTACIVVPLYQVPSDCARDAQRVKGCNDPEHVNVLPMSMCPSGQATLLDQIQEYDTTKDTPEADYSSFFALTGIAYSRQNKFAGIKLSSSWENYGGEYQHAGVAKHNVSHASLCVLTGFVKTMWKSTWKNEVRVGSVSGECSSMQVDSPALVSIKKPKDARKFGAFQKAGMLPRLQIDAGTIRLVFGTNSATPETGDEVVVSLASIKTGLNGGEDQHLQQPGYSEAQCFTSAKEVQEKTGTRCKPEQDDPQVLRLQQHYDDCTRRGVHKQATVTMLGDRHSTFASLCTLNGIANFSKYGDEPGLIALLPMSAERCFPMNIVKLVGTSRRTGEAYSYVIEPHGTLRLSSVEGMTNQLELNLDGAWFIADPLGRPATDLGAYTIPATGYDMIGSTPPQFMKSHYWSKSDTLIPLSQPANLSKVIQRKSLIKDTVVEIGNAGYVQDANTLGAQYTQLSLLCKVPWAGSKWPYGACPEQKVNNNGAICNAFNRWLCRCWIQKRLVCFQNHQGRLTCKQFKRAVRTTGGPMAGPYGLFAKHEEWHDFTKKEPKSAEFRDECKYEDLDQRCYEHCTERLLAL